MSSYATIETEAIPTADTEQSLTLPDDFEEYVIKLRTNAILKLAYQAGDIAAGTYITIPAGSSKSLEANLNGREIYFTSSIDPNVLEIEIVERR